MATPTQIAQVRVLSGDIVDPDNPVLTDDQLNTILGAVSDNVLAATANALRTVAVNEALLFKKVRIEGLETDGPALAEVLLKAAKQFDDLLASDSADDITGGITARTDIGAF